MLHEKYFPFLPQERAEIARYYRSHGCMATCRAFGLNRQSLSNILRKEQVPFLRSKAPNGRYRKLLPKDDARLRRLHENGRSVDDLAREAGVSPWTARDAIRRAGGHFRTRAEDTALQQQRETSLLRRILNALFRRSP